jgi:anti-sigma-K factor RskA
MASNLPAPPEGKTYEMWLIPKTGNPVPAGLFQSDAEGSAMHMQHVSVDMASTKAIAVTLEPAGGVPQPTSQPVIVAAL